MFILLSIAVLIACAGAMIAEGWGGLTRQTFRMWWEPGLGWSWATSTV